VARSVPAVVRALDVLELFLDGRGSLSAPEVAAALDLPRTTTHELLATLSERDYVERLPDNAHRFRLGVRVSELGSVYADALDVVRDGQALVEEVSARCGEICQLGLLDRRDVVYVARAGMSAAALAAVDSTPVAANPRRTAAVRTAAGRVLLAHLPRPDLDRRLGGGAMGAGGAVGPDSAAGQTSGVHPQPYPAAAHAFGQQIPPPHAGPPRAPLPHPSTLTPAGDHRTMRSIPPGMGEHAPGDAAAAERLRIWRDLAAVVARGVATDAEGVEPSSHAIAAAIRDHTGRVVAALEIRTPVGRWEPQRSVGLETLVRRAALRASARLGFRPQRAPEGPPAGAAGSGPRSLIGATGSGLRPVPGAGVAAGAPGATIGAPAPQALPNGAPPGRLAAAHRLSPAANPGAAAAIGAGGVRPPTRPPVPVRPALSGRPSVPVRPVDAGGLRPARPAALGTAPADGRFPGRRPGVAAGLPPRRPLVGGRAPGGPPAGPRQPGPDGSRPDAAAIGAPRLPGSPLRPTLTQPARPGSANGPAGSGNGTESPRSAESRHPES
jgi:DNA-binding IclR family transcriptional regulator